MAKSVSQQKPNYWHRSVASRSIRRRSSNRRPQRGRQKNPRDHVRKIHEGAARSGGAGECVTSEGDITLLNGEAFFINYHGAALSAYHGDMQKSSLSLIAIVLMLALGCRAPAGLLQESNFAVGQRYDVLVPHALLDNEILKKLILSPVGRGADVPKSVEEYNSDPSSYHRVIAVSTNSTRIRISRLKPLHLAAFGWLVDVFADVETGPFAGKEVSILNFTEHGSGYRPETKMLRKVGQ